jgi:hypothetical protein
VLSKEQVPADVLAAAGIAAEQTICEDPHHVPALRSNQSVCPGGGFGSDRAPRQGDKLADAFPGRTGWIDGVTGRRIDLLEPFQRFDGIDVAFDAAVSGSPSFGCQWRFNATNLVNSGRLSGATTNLLTSSNVQSNDAGAYTVVVTNSYGSATGSPSATLTMGPGFIPESRLRTNGQFRCLFGSAPGQRFDVLLGGSGVGGRPRRPATLADQAGGKRAETKGQRLTTNG